GSCGPLAPAWPAVLRTLLAYPVPVVAGVQGAVAGAGIGLLGACDIVVCARSTKIRPAYGALGFSPDGGNSWHLGRSLRPPPRRPPAPRPDAHQRSLHGRGGTPQRAGRAAGRGRGPARDRRRRRARDRG